MGVCDRWKHGVCSSCDVCGEYRLLASCKGVNSTKKGPRPRTPSSARKVQRRRLNRSSKKCGRNRSTYDCSSCFEALDIPEMHMETKMESMESVCNLDKTAGDSLFDVEMGFLQMAWLKTIEVHIPQPKVTTTVNLFLNISLEKITQSA